MKILAALILLVLLAAAAGAGYVWYSIEKPYGRIPSEGLYVDIPHGTSRRAVAHILKNAGVIRNSFAFEFYARRHPKRTLEAGEYLFDHPLAGKDVFWKLANGEVYQQPFTVREGETIFDIARNLEAAKLMAAGDFLKAAEDPSEIKDLFPEARTLEGFLFPATYNLPRHAPAEELTEMMVRKFRDALADVLPNGSEWSDPTVSIGSVVTLASLVERETPKPDERPLVAGVFTNRLARNMPLQCDPTVIYALQMDDEYNGTLTLKDLRLNSPYNTYRNKGLPPGPIGNPGEVAMRAALHPAQTDYLYFVANTQGGHFFASSLADHNKNVAKYHRLLNGEPAEPPVVEAHHTHAGGPTRKGKR
ncbi:MAG TPA: endolytic transglycosylase MltG [Candidatus Sulfotelmatobacter sp.]|nr:endolytic transglycosylase MltG [Candidatus Sulfotelmatobacter sp.]